MLKIRPLCICAVDACANYDCSGRGECVMYLGTTPRCVCDDVTLSDSSGQNLNCDREQCDDGSYCYNGGRCS